MGFEIKDGTGSNRKASVNINNELKTSSIIETEREAQSIQGDAFIVGSGFVDLTSQLPTSVLYFKNTGDEDLLITRFLVGCRGSSGGTENHVRGVIVSNPIGMTAGTGSPCAVNNTNFGSSNTIDFEGEVGLEGASLVGGSNYLATVAPLEQLSSENASTVLPKGSSIGVTIIPPPSNTALQVSVGINLHKVRN